MELHSLNEQFEITISFIPLNLQMFYVFVFLFAKSRNTIAIAE